MFGRGSCNEGSRGSPGGERPSRGGGTRSFSFSEVVLEEAFRDRATVNSAPSMDHSGTALLRPPSGEGDSQRYSSAAGASQQVHEREGVAYGGHVDVGCGGTGDGGAGHGGLDFGGAGHGGA